MSRPRTFDHAEALRLRTEERMTTVAIGQRFGVSHSQVSRATTTAKSKPRRRKKKAADQVPLRARRWAHRAWATMSDHDRWLIGEGLKDMELP